MNAAKLVTILILFINMAESDGLYTEIDECKAFKDNKTLDEHCIKGVCSNLPGSWNCTCPDERLWMVMPNGTYRCQGNFTYFGEISLLVDNISLNESFIGRLMNGYINQLYKSTTVNETGNMELRLLFVSVNVFNVSKVLSSIGALNNFTLMFSLRISEAVSVDSLQVVLGEYNISKTINLNVTRIIITSNLIYQEDTNILCNLTNFGGCDPISTNCKQANGSTHCVCKPGFENLPDQSKFCYDINECTNVTRCSGGKCINSDGSYTCQCNDGYRKNVSIVNEITCEDVNECETAGVCPEHGTCNNNIGSYICQCENGFTLNNSNTQNLTCQDIDECSTNVNLCSGHGNCTNTPGHYNCSCHNGFIVDYANENNITCVDIDECQNKTLCPNNTICNNQIGNYTCECKEGYQINGTVCTDIDECSVKRPCANGSKCYNTIGSYKCTCEKGYAQINDTTCQDVDECENKTLCPANSTCNNNPGSYTCPCNDGYTRNNSSTCQDIDECNQTGLMFCSEHGKCQNDVGGYTCMCEIGYRVNNIDVKNITCDDIDECHDASYYCGGNCTNTDGAWFCDCIAGYINNTSADNKSVFCTDVDECAKNAKACIGGFCQNTNGSWTCSCGEGKNVKVINETTKECSVQLTTETSPTENKTVMCFACDETYSPSFCETIKACESNELCFVEKISSPEGKMHYKSGCRRKEICQQHQFNKDSGCFECCDGSFCNSRGCGDPGYPARGTRGPVCLDCVRVNHPHNCDQIRLCSSDQVCYVEELAWGDTSLFHLGCRNVHQCAADGMVIKRSLPRCTSCCNSDFCNVECKKQELSVMLIG